MFRIACLALLTLVPLARADKDDARLKGYRAPEGVKVEIVAEAPAVVNPVGLTFAEDGTPYVLERLPSPGDEGRETTEEVVYKDGSKRKFTVPTKRVKDVFKALSSSKDNGVYDRAKAVFEEDSPSAVLLHDGWLYVAGRGSVHRYKPSKEGGAFDGKEIVARGFAGVTGLTPGGDGWLYLSAAAGDHHAEGSDGGRVSVLHTGTIFRCRPDGSRLQAVAVGFRGSGAGVGFDEHGRMFHADENRLLHVSEAGDFGARLRVPEVFGGLPAILRSGLEHPSGVLVLDDGSFPEPYRGLLIVPDPQRRVVRACKVAPHGATFKVVEEIDLLTSDDTNFRPCQVVLGPDGAIYVVDSRADPKKPWGDGKSGRIYRLTWAGTKEHAAIASRSMDSWAKIRKLDEAELLKVLTGENGGDRETARQEFARRGDKHRAALLKVVGDDSLSNPARITALGALESMWSKEATEACGLLLRSLEPELRRSAVEALGRNGQAKGQDVVGLLEDQNAAVRRAAAIALARTAEPDVADILANALTADEGKDAVALDGLVRAVEMLGKTGIERLMAQAESGEQKKIDRIVETFRRLRVRSAADVLPQLLKNPHLSIQQRADLVRSWNNYLLDPPLDMGPLVDYLTKSDEATAVKQAGVEVLTANGGLRGEKAQKWVLELLEDTDPGLRVAVLRAVEKGVLKQAGPAVEKIADDEGRPAEERRAAARALEALKK